MPLFRSKKAAAAKERRWEPVHDHVGPDEELIEDIEVYLLATPLQIDSYGMWRREKYGRLFLTSQAVITALKIAPAAQEPFKVRRTALNEVVTSRYGRRPRWGAKIQGSGVLELVLGTDLPAAMKSSRMADRKILSDGH